MRYGPDPWSEISNWDWLTHDLKHVTRSQRVGDGEVTLDIHVGPDGVNVTDFDITTVTPRTKMLALGTLEDIKRRAERAEFEVPRVVVQSSNDEEIEPLLEQAGFKTYRPLSPDTPTLVVGVIEAL